MDLGWCPSGNGSAAASDANGKCVELDAPCSQPLITSRDACPGDEPSSKKSCTLCTLDAYTWCPDLDAASEVINEYEGRCLARGPCPKPRRIEEYHHRHHWHEEHHHHHHHHHGHEDGDEPWVHGITSVRMCQLDNASNLSAALGIASVGLWIGTVTVCCLCATGCGVCFAAYGLLSRKRNGRRCFRCCSFNSTSTEGSHQPHQADASSFIVDGHGQHPNVVTAGQQAAAQQRQATRLSVVRPVSMELQHQARQQPHQHLVSNNNSSAAVLTGDGFAPATLYPDIKSDGAYRLLDQNDESNTDEL
eukprot:CAMPEP_0167786480 /NCGR_PEP_ID=MMETSP0111_2-20121227/8822_1 /TAXON_ID=91324 /ORGANISM="Lotharella globosa, Strain CCCM811" /LENGTH=304 /DNA_ID=CAMNT_0007677879 /DNA_START=216 /DNA_END=1130 /DNA_ORIENTATION=+